VEPDCGADVQPGIRDAGRSIGHKAAPQLIIRGSGLSVLLILLYYIAWKLHVQRSGARDAGPGSGAFAANVLGHSSFHRAAQEKHSK